MKLNIQQIFQNHALNGCDCSLIECIKSLNHFSQDFYYKWELTSQERSCCLAGIDGNVFSGSMLIQIISNQDFCFYFLLRYTFTPLCYFADSDYSVLICYYYIIINFLHWQSYSKNIDTDNQTSAEYQPQQSALPIIGPSLLSWFFFRLTLYRI